MRSDIAALRGHGRMSSPLGWPRPAPTTSGVTVRPSPRRQGRAVVPRDRQLIRGGRELGGRAVWGRAVRRPLGPLASHVHPQAAWPTTTRLLLVALELEAPVLPSRPSEPVHLWPRRWPRVRPI